MASIGKGLTKTAPEQLDSYVDKGELMTEMQD